jgi:hypothetical protein
VTGNLDGLLIILDEGNTKRSENLKMDLVGGSTEEILDMAVLVGISNELFNHFASSHVNCVMSHPTLFI